MKLEEALQKSDINLATCRGEAIDALFIDYRVRSISDWTFLTRTVHLLWIPSSSSYSASSLEELPEKVKEALSSENPDIQAEILRVLECDRWKADMAK